MVLKPAEATSLIALELAKIFEEAGLPKGLLSVLVGRGSIIGDAIAQHPLVRKISLRVEQPRGDIWHTLPLTN